jgi:hypothetical protein
MVQIPAEYAYALNNISDILAVRPEWLVWPGIINLFIVPLVLNVFMFYYLISRIINVFPNWINYILAGIMAYLALPFNNITIFIAPLIIGMLGISSGVLLRLMVIGGIYSFLIWILPWILKMRF